MVFLPNAQLFFNFYTEIALTSINAFIEIQLNNGIKVYRGIIAIKKIYQLLTKYLLSKSLRKLFKFCLSIK